MRISEALKGLGRPVAYYPSLARVVGSVNAALLLCQLLYWEGKQANPERWIFKTQDQLEEETALSRKEQETARKTLRTKKLLEERYIGLPRRLEYRLNLEKLDELWTLSIMPESGTMECPKGTDKEAPKGHSYYTEITPEITPETTPSINQKEGRTERSSEPLNNDDKEINNPRNEIIDQMFGLDTDCPYVQEALRRLDASSNRRGIRHKVAWVKAVAAQIREDDAALNILANQKTTNVAKYDAMALVLERIKRNGTHLEDEETED